MHIAEVLSDLTSLRVCGPAEALALVRASSGLDDADVKSGPPTSAITRKEDTTPGSKENDPDLKKVYDLMNLHEMVKTGYAQTHDSELRKAREEVDRMVTILRGRGQ